MKAVLLSTTILSALAVSASSSARSRDPKAKKAKSSKGIEDTDECKDPLAAIQHTLQCIADGDALCAAEGYDAAAFKKIHNGKDTGIVLGDGGEYWQFALQLSTLSFSFDHEANIGPNMASIRYIEGVKFTDGTAFGLPASTDYPFSAYSVQHEHALVTVDDDCKMTKWDQYGDDAEQSTVDNTSGAVIGVFCAMNVFPPNVCASFGITGPE